MPKTTSKTNQKTIQKPTPSLDLPIYAETNWDLNSAREIVQRFSLHKCDYIIAGDGSATTWSKTAGFGSILYTRTYSNGCENVRQRFFGGLSAGTNNVAEIMAVLHPLLYLDETVNTKHQKPCVYIFSDSEYVVKTGMGEFTRKHNLALWKAIDSIGERFLLNFRYSPRLVLPANVYGDTMGNIIRKSMEQQRS